MAEVIDDSYDFDPYPWSTWLDGQVWRCKRGEDFKVRTDTFKDYAKRAARDRGHALDVKVEGDEAVVLRAKMAPPRRVRPEVVSIGNSEGVPV